MDDVVTCADATVDTAGDTSCTTTLAAGDRTILLIVQDRHGAGYAQDDVTVHVDGDTGS